MNTDDLQRWMTVLFDPDEHVWAAWTGNFTAKSTTQDDAIQRLCNWDQWTHDDLEGGARIGLNSAWCPGAERNGESAQPLLRNLMFEFDDAPLEDQWTLVRKSGLPYSSAIFSGNKSIHVVISLEKPLPRTDFVELWKRVYVALLAQAEKIGSVVKPDDQTSSPVQWARAPFSSRCVGGKWQPQKLLKLHGRVKNQDLKSWLHTEDNYGAWLLHPFSRERTFIRGSGSSPSEKTILEYAKSLGIEGRGYTACPSCQAEGHDNKGSNLGITIGDRVTVKCFRGCSFKEVVSAMSESVSLE